MWKTVMTNTFTRFATEKGNPNYNTSVSRLSDMYKQQKDIRTDFYRDYTRILHSTAYRRLKHKTQVFFATGNDHICTRMEHVNHVASVSYTIAKELGLNTELTNAIATGHDLGHAPFGHQGETVLKGIALKNDIESFWHEKNSLFFIDNLELLPDSSNNFQNLNLTYAVRDGIICHCGEVDENALFPRQEAIDLSTIQTANEHRPYTWEGCVVKVSDKIAYLGRDIEDALLLKFLDRSLIKKLKELINKHSDEKIDIKQITNTSLIHRFIMDICKSSSPEKGLNLSPNNLLIMKDVKEFNYKYIYKNPRLDPFKEYSSLIIHSIFNKLIDNKEYFLIPENDYGTGSHTLNTEFMNWINKYSYQNSRHYWNKKVFDIDNYDLDYKRSALYFISGMTDHYAIKIFNEFNSF